MGRKFQSPEGRFGDRGCQGGLCSGDSHHCHKGRFVLLSWCRSGPWHSSPGIWEQGESRIAELRAWAWTLKYLQTMSRELLWAVQKPCSCPGLCPTCSPSSFPSQTQRSRGKSTVCISSHQWQRITLAKSRLTGYILPSRRSTKSVTSVTGKNTSKCLELEHRRWLLTVLKSRKNYPQELSEL